MTHSRIAAGALIAALTFGLGATALAAETSTRDIAALEQQSKHLADAARNTKGGPQQELLLRRARLRSIIDRLQKGEQVDPQEIDPLLR